MEGGTNVYNFLLHYQIIFQKLEEQFAIQLEEQEAIFGPANSMLPINTSPPSHHRSYHHRSSTRSSLSSMSAD